MRILLIESHLLENGAIRVSIDRATRWVHHGAEVTLFVVGWPELGKEQTVAVPDEISVVSAAPRWQREGTQIHRFRRSVAWRLAPVATLLHGLRLAHRADVIVAGREIGPGLLAAARIASLSRTPFAVTIQSHVGRALDQHVHKRLHRRMIQALRRADMTVCTSRGLADVLVSYKVSMARNHILYNGVDQHTIRDQAQHPPSLSPLPSPLVVASGRLSNEKGFDILIQAHAEALRGEAPPHSLLILGEGNQRGDLEALAERLGVADTVFMPGFVENPHALVARADLFVLSSRWEGFGLVLVEALHAGTPIVATDCVSGPAEILEGGAYGQLVPVGDVAALAKAITAHLQAPADLRARAAAGGSSAARRFDPDRSARRHLELLKTLVK